MRISDWSSDVCSSDLLGLFRQPYRGLEGRRKGVALTAESRRLACEAAAKACVLLKHDVVLPLTREGRTIALVGTLADSRANLPGTWAVPARPERTEERRGGNVCVSPCRSRGSPYYSQKK